MREINLPGDVYAAVVQGKLHHLIQSGLEYQVDGVLILREQGVTGILTGRQVEAKVTYITSEKNHCALSPQALAPNTSVLSIQLI